MDISDLMHQILESRSIKLNWRFEVNEIFKISNSEDI